MAFKYLCAALLFFPAVNCFAQTTTIIDSSDKNYRTVIAGAEYQAGGMKKLLLGEDWRREWTTPVRVRMLNLDTLGGLTPLEMGGGRQTKTLHVQAADGRRYVLRSVNKTYTLALPEIARGTIVETVMNDQIATNHPYAALAVPMMANAAGVYHTNPKLYIIPNSNRLGEYRSTFSNMLVVMEERPDKTHAQLKSFGQPDDIDGSEKMLERITDDNDVQMDQGQYVKTRLFDMFLGDWGRHIDNWRWAEFKDGKTDIYRPVPKDRDQTWAKFEGLLLKLASTVGGLKQLQSFGPKIKNIEWYNFPAVDIDRRFGNELNKQQWIDSATALQRYLTNDVIEKGVRQLPPEIFAISGQQIISSLQQRRNDLPSYAEAYYNFLSKKVDLAGSKKNELFRINRIDDQQTQITTHKITKEGVVKEPPLYSRTFLTNETKEVRIYGLDGNDVYHLEGNTSDGITVRMIAGPGKDSLYDASHVRGLTHKSKFYDDVSAEIISTSETKLRLSDSVFHDPFDEDFHFDHKGLSIKPGLNPFYRLYVGAAYHIRSYGWREQPYKSDIRIGLDYSLSENTFHPYLAGEHPQLFSAWNLTYGLGYDGSRRFHYFGVGNNSTKDLNIASYYFLRTENYYASAGINRFISNFHNIAFNLGYDGVRVIRAPQTFLAEPRAKVTADSYDWKHFASAGLSYNYNRVNDKITPTKGFHFNAGTEYTLNWQDKNSFNRYTAAVGFYLPLAGDFSFFVNSGAATMNGEPEFYQLNNIGGSITLRGYLRNRFYGKTVFYDQNELRWIPDVKTYLFNGKIGLIGLYDIGRVWQPLEKSNDWHFGYGGGFMVAPFNKFSATVYYTVSPEDNVVNIRIGKFF